MEKHGTKIIYSYYFEILSYFNFSFSNSEINVICGNITKEKKKIYSCNTCNEKKKDINNEHYNSGFYFCT